VVFYEVCKKFTHPPAACHGMSNTKSPMTAIIIVFLIMTILLGAILMYYRKAAKKEISTEMSIQVSQMVSQYFALHGGKEDQL